MKKLGTQTNPKEDGKRPKRHKQHELCHDSSARIRRSSSKAHLLAHPPTHPPTADRKNTLLTALPPRLAYKMICEAVYEEAYPTCFCLDYPIAPMYTQRNRRGGEEGVASRMVDQGAPSSASEGYI